VAKSAPQDERSSFYDLPAVRGFYDLKKHVVGSKRDDELRLAFDQFIGGFQVISKGIYALFEQ
jgi:hypothetical protein